MRLCFHETLLTLMQLEYFVCERTLIKFITIKTKPTLMMNYSIPTSKEIAAKARDLILEDLSVYDSIPALAKKAGTNPYTLKKIFKEQYGLSVFEFSRSERIVLAKKLLQETNYTLQTIGEMVGYTEGNNFQVAFKGVVGVTPGEFRKIDYVCLW